MTPSEQRESVVDFVRSQLMGPLDGEDETLEEPPTMRYVVGTLYPQDVDTVIILEEDEPEGPSGADQDDVLGGRAEDPVTLSSQRMPSSVGISFYSEAGSLDVVATGARYHEVDVDGDAGESRSRRVWRREALGDGLPVRLRAPEGRDRVRETRDVFDGHGKVHVFWRPSGNGHLVTVTLLNARVGAGDGPPEPSDVIAQAGLRVHAVGGSIAEYPDVELLTTDTEEHELALQYRRHRTYAVGHGAAADWNETGPGEAEWVAVDFVPAHETPQLVPKRDDREILRLDVLANADADVAGLERGLRDFVGAYRTWIEGLPTLHTDVPPWMQPARDRVLDRLHQAADRMDEGVDLLTGESEESHQARRAFALANLAVTRAMRHGRDDLAGRVHDRGDVDLPDSYDGLDHAWRPFQLAFQLLVLPSASSVDHEARELVDLLWFPTGGGKTEAYLAIAAHVIFLERLRDPDTEHGTVVITRYTLRLLTAQQFQRASTMVCAAELIRQDNEDELGQEPITIGLWVGRGATPNTIAQAKEVHDELIEAERPGAPFQLDRCPWCGTRSAPERRTEDPGDYGVHVTNRDVVLHCTHEPCPFSDRLPANVVDDVLYGRPPTFLIATVDKFARLTWVPEAGVFLGAGASSAPSLIIQDELHLLSGPLGTTVGLYECAIDAVIAAEGGRPKVIASTATIRRADDQSKGLFGRHARVFPPPGLESDDSWFSRTADDEPGRLYVGVMSQSVTPTFALVHLAAGVAEAPVALESSLSEDALDAYWTQVVYHNSLRELGKTVTLARDDVPARIRVITDDESRMRDLGDDGVEELTSNVPGQRLAGILSRMGTPRSDPDALDLVACTNMLSVGVDVPRLGLMVVNGQPKTTSEYIQATSRVGRSSGRPGIVFVLYSGTKPRDRSHYESFRGYHGSLYRHVEPTSVTPFALPSRTRSLHAGLVILARHLLGASQNQEAISFDVEGEKTREALDQLLAVVERVDPREVDATRQHLERLLDEWETRQKQDHRLSYYDASLSIPSLLKNFGANGDGWETLHSMRSVDRTCRLRVYGAE